MDEDATIAVTSEEKSGETFAPAGTYTLDVRADGSWTIEIVPNG